MLSKNKVKSIKALNNKKVRTETHCFLAEGNKLVADLLPYYDCDLLVCCPSWLATQTKVHAQEQIIVEQEDINNASLLKNPQQVIAIFKQPTYTLSPCELKNQLCLVLDDIQDPGNLGTIIRLADWFGIEHIICSKGTVDAYNPKVIQATMGAITRVQIHYTELASFIEEMKETHKSPIYGTFLEGENLYQSNITPHGLIVMGNEGNGISKGIEAMVTQKIHIPNFPESRTTSESLNVAIATSVICAEFRRRQI